MKKIILSAVLLVAAAACKPKAPEPAVPQPKAGEPAAASAPAVPAAAETERLRGQTPGNYVRTAVGQVEKAKAAKALFEKTEKDHLKELNLAGK